MKSSRRPRQHLDRASKLYPNAWGHIETFRSGRGVDLPDWPDWCFMPMAAWYSIVSAHAGVATLTGTTLVSDVGRLASLGAWRYTQGVYQLDDDLFAGIAGTIPSGALPSEILLRMPEWCVYIVTPGMQWLESELYGFFAHLEWDANTGRNEVRLLIDSEDSLTPLPLHLGNWTIIEAIDRSVSESRRNVMKHDISIGEYALDNLPIDLLAEKLYPLISLLLYVCSNGVEYPDRDRPCNPQAVKTRRHGWKLFPADKPRVWTLGKKTGEKLRSTLQSDSTKNGGTNKKPHVRRAHWHGYWHGPKSGKREFKLHWIPPTVVAAGDDH